MRRGPIYRAPGGRGVISSHSGLSDSLCQTSSLHPISINRTEKGRVSVGARAAVGGREGPCGRPPCPGLLLGPSTRMSSLNYRQLWATTRALPAPHRHPRPYGHPRSVVCFPKTYLPLKAYTPLFSQLSICIPVTWLNCL